jgi:Flp pilus assembly protein TadD
MKFPFHFTAVALALAALGASARADQVADVDTLFRGGKQQQALAQADQYLKAQPRDARMRFLRGVILTDMGRTDQAVEAFRQLTSDFPELPEPYNNLAVIYAARGQYEMARDALETAVRNNPRYATGQENLGDVYVQLARESYLRAQSSLDKTVADVPLTRKLTLVRELLSQSKQAHP